MDESKKSEYYKRTIAEGRERGSFDRRKWVSEKGDFSIKKPEDVHEKKIIED